MYEEPVQPPNATPWRGAIGLCLSGGGYRAAAYHLGTLAYLERLGLLANVRMVSVASGAAFTLASYALSLVEGAPFDSYFRQFYQRLRDTDLLELGMRELVTRGPDRPSGRENAVLSMADVFAREFFSDPSGHAYRFGALLDADFHLDEMVFNALDFRSAQIFRFQRSQSEDAVIGHRDAPIPRDDARHIRIADIVATSVSIPVAFEPLSFPDDYDWPDGEIPPGIRDAFSGAGGAPAPVPLMDGGLHDNQGIESLLQADERDPDELDLVVLSDVFRSRDDYYHMTPPRGLGGPRIGTLIPLAWALAVVCGVTAAATAWRAGQLVSAGAFEPPWDLLVYGVPLVMSAVVLMVLYRVRRLARDVLHRIPRVHERSERFIRRIQLDQLIDMLELRVASTVAASASVVWTRVRELGYRLVFDNPTYEGKRISSLITHLREDEPFADLPGVAPPTPALHRVVGVAWSMPTILWFESESQLPCVVAAAQATLCFNLMKLITRRWGKDPAAYPADVSEMWARLGADWERLRADPYALLVERLPGAELDRPPATDEPGRSPGQRPR